MDGAKVAFNCLCSVRSCATCWCPDNELANGHRGACQYRRMAEVMEQLDAARDELLDKDNVLVGRVKDVNEVEKRLRHTLLPRNAWRLLPFFELFMCAPNDELHQWLVLCIYFVYGWYFVYTMHVLQYYEFALCVLCMYFNIMNFKYMYYVYTLFISGIWASLETILLLLCSIATPRNYGIQTLSIARESHC
jgi:hypothetical protein